jgi:hypothetical protein
MRIAEADYGLTAQAMGGRNAPNPDDNLRVFFSMIPVEDEEASAREGRPIYKEKEHITIMVPGDRDVMVRQSWKKDHDRFPRQYQAFINGRNQDAVSGTPLKLMTFLTAAQVKELEFFNCVTVEQLANLPDAHAQRFMQLNKLKQLAADYLKAAQEAAPLTAMRAEIDKKDNEIQTLTKQVQDLATQVQALADKKESKK